jgi:hypothetical protein
MLQCFDLEWMFPIPHFDMRIQGLVSFMGEGWQRDFSTVRRTLIAA